MSNFWTYVAPTAAISGVALGFIYWLFATFVTKCTCKSQEDCIEGKISSLESIMKSEFQHLREFIKGELCNDRDRDS